MFRISIYTSNFAQFKGNYSLSPEEAAGVYLGNRGGELVSFRARSG